MLRFYARFIVVSLLLNRRQLAKELIDELSAKVAEYNRVFKPSDAQEWLVVLQEITAFTQADQYVHIHDTPATSALVLRMQAEDFVALPSTADSRRRLVLEEALLIGNRQQQVKFSELTLDVLRMAQALERESSQGQSHQQNPGPASQPTHQTPTQAHTHSHPHSHQGAPPALLDDDPIGGLIAAAATVAAVKPDHPAEVAGLSGGHSSAHFGSNPRKHLLYQPSVTTVLTHIATAFSQLSEAGVLMLYLSADGTHRGASGSAAPVSEASAAAIGIQTVFSTLNLATGSEHPASLLPPIGSYREGVHLSAGRGPASGAAAMASSLCPEDLLPFSRKPLFCVIDSDNSHAFANFPNLFGQPVLLLLSPRSQPVAVADPIATGSLFTLCLASPFSGFALAAGAPAATAEQYKAFRAQLHFFFEELLALLISSDLGPSISYFLDDDFLRLLILRFVLFRGLCLAHAPLAAKPEFLPESQPQLPQTFWRNPLLKRAATTLLAIFSPDKPQ
eukprot:TRINITY_DN9541_c0_g1_i1.p1 TRINITY_DN9541_c0_g1~~TRINITY_DN9541_c0_g1_i1.p1  ORF type:complete len:577 (+),score=118.93 TRINITY_DN9541_c0_g1_i1:216-1733(+)